MAQWLGCRSLANGLFLPWARSLFDRWPLWVNVWYGSANQSNSAFHPHRVGGRVLIHVFTRVTEVETFNNGRLGLHLAVWLQRSKSVSAGLGCCSYRLNAGPVCNNSSTEGRICAHVSKPYLYLLSESVLAVGKLDCIARSFIMGMNSSTVHSWQINEFVVLSKMDLYSLLYLYTFVIGWGASDNRGRLFRHRWCSCWRQWCIQQWPECRSYGRRWRWWWRFCWCWWWGGRHSWPWSVGHRATTQWRWAGTTFSSLEIVIFFVNHWFPTLG